MQTCILSGFGKIGDEHKTPIEISKISLKLMAIRFRQPFGKIDRFID